MLTSSAIAEAMGMGRGRIYRALSRPHPLPYIKKKSPPKGGGQTKFYTIGNVIARMRAHFGSLDSITVAKLYELGGCRKNKGAHQ